MTSRTLPELLVEHSDALEGLVRRHAGALVRFETHDDLAQRVRVHLLESAGAFQWQGEAAFHGWLRTAVRNCLNNHRAHWNAARRAAGHLLRVTYGPVSAPEAVARPADLAAHLDLSEASAARARQRALERFRRAFELMSRAT